MTFVAANMPHCVSGPRPALVFGKVSRLPQTSVGSRKEAAIADATDSSPKSQNGMNSASIFAALNLSTMAGTTSFLNAMPFSLRSSISTIFTKSGRIARITAMKRSFCFFAKFISREARLTGATPSVIVFLIIVLLLSSQTFPAAPTSSMRFSANACTASIGFFINRSSAGRVSICAASVSINA